MEPIRAEISVAGMTMIRLFSILVRSFSQASAKPPPVSVSGRFHIVDKLTFWDALRPLLTIT